MGSISTALREDLSEESGLEVFELAGIRPLQPKWRNALAKRIPRWGMLFGGQVGTPTSQGLSSLFLSGLAEDTSTSKPLLILETGFEVVWNTTSELAIFPPVQPLEDLVEIPKELGKRQGPVIRGKGVPVWVLVSYAMKRRLTPEQISQLWNGYVTTQEVKAALAYRRRHPEAVDDKLSDLE